ncbi:MAG: glycoside hydrolase family 3 C-terminal domain-containing protein [Phycisphaerae bacterium]|nr:glycoside hydrolase family 3 C-terminal domain-containing protein [Phycisphaerae bacterium]
MNDTNDPVYLNPDAPLADRVEDLLSRMTLEEKVSQMLFDSPAIERLGVPAYNWWNECLHGVARAGAATVFPQAIGMAASWNVDLLHRVGTAISDEGRAKHHQAIRQGNRDIYFGLTFWTPNINIFRDPRWGRGQETYGEDPYLTSRLGVAFCRALQGDDPKYLKSVATPKHYAVHSGPEPERHFFNAVCSRRDLRETYLPAFQACVQEGGAMSVMGAYNRTNGEPCCASPTLLQKILRDEWGFEGYVVSDCGALCDLHLHHKVTKSPAESAALAVANGCDLNCGDVYHHLNAAFQAGLLREEQIDLCVRRLLTARFRLGMFDPPRKVPYASIPVDVVECPEHRALARTTARESIVLLKNEDNLLPLDPAKLKKIFVVGPMAMNQRVLLSNYYGVSENLVTLLEGVAAAVPKGTCVTCEKGCHEFLKDSFSSPYLLEAEAKQADVIVACLGTTPEMEGEEGAEANSDGGGDRTNITLPGSQEELLKKLAAFGKPVVLVLTGGSPIAFEWAKENIPAILMCWYPGEEGGNAVADVLFGKYNPAGRLPVTFVKSLEQLPPFDDYTMAGRTYRFLQDEPLYRFGYGLSYTTFAYDNLQLSKETIDGLEDSVTVSIDVTNTGPRDGDEVVQLYVRDTEASVPVPELHLEGFQRIHLKNGETKTVSFELTGKQLVCFDDDGNPMLEPGVFEISVGGGQPEDSAGGAKTVVLTVV